MAGQFVGAPVAGVDAAAPERRRRRPLRKRLGSVVFHLCCLLALLVCLYPGLWMVGSSFKQSKDVVASVSPFPTSATFDNYATALAGIAGTSFWTFFSNSLMLAVASVLLVNISCSLTAYAFARIKFPGKQMWFSLMIATLLVPAHVMLIPQYIIFQKLHLVNTYVPLLIGKALAVEAFYIFLMVQFIRGLPRELDEAAQIDGAGHVRIYTSIILPLLRPALITTGIFVFVASWNDFLGPLLYVKKPDMYTLPLALQMYVDATTTANYGAQIAMANLALVPVILVFFVFQRYLLDGVSTSGLKG